MPTSGFLLKDAKEQQLVAAIRVVAGGASLFAPSVTRRLIERFAQPQRKRAAPQLDLLTNRELDVLRLVARGHSNAEISAALGISEHTTKTHVASVLQKLDLRNRVQAVVFDYENGVVQPAGAAKP